MTKESSNTGKLGQAELLVVGHLADKLFASGSDLGALLQERLEITPANARQIVSRLLKSKVISSSKPYKFGKGQFIYLRRGLALSLETVKSICFKSRPPIYRLLQAMEENKGIISMYEAMKVTASPGEGSTTKVTSLRDIIKLLNKLSLVAEISDESSGKYLILTDAVSEFSITDDNSQRVKVEKQRMVEDTLMLPDILRWFSSINLFDFQNSQFRNLNTPGNGVWHNTMLWDAISYTRTTGINSFNASKADEKAKKTFVALDVLVSKPYTSVQLDGFVSRLQIHTNAVKDAPRKVLPIVVYKACSHEVLAKMRKLGFLAFNIASVFGERVYNILSEVGALVNGDVPNADVDEAVRATLEAIREAGQEEALGKVKGILFEVLLYPLLANIFPQSIIERSQLLKAEEEGKQKDYEFDYIITSNSPKEIIVAELKGYKKSKVIPFGNYNTKETLQWFFGRTFPHAKKAMKGKADAGYPIRALFLTSASFDDEGKEFIVNANNGKQKATNVKTAYDRADLIELLKAKGFNLEVKIIQTYFD